MTHSVSKPLSIKRIIYSSIFIKWGIPLGMLGAYAYFLLLLSAMQAYRNPLPHPDQVGSDLRVISGSYQERDVPGKMRSIDSYLVTDKGTVELNCVIRLPLPCLGYSNLVGTRVKAHVTNGTYPFVIEISDSSTGKILLHREKQLAHLAKVHESDAIVKKAFWITSISLIAFGSLLLAFSLLTNPKNKHQ